MEKGIYDVVIIGSGPAGLSAAVELSKYQNLKCLIIEKNDFLDVKTRSWCTFNSVLKKYDLMKSTSHKLNFVEFRTPSGVKFKVDLGSDFLWVLNEKKFKKALLKRITIEKKDNLLVESIDFTDNKVILKSKGEDIITKILIDASGNAGLSRNKFKIKTETRTHFKCRVYENCNFIGDTAPWGIMVSSKKKK